MIDDDTAFSGWSKAEMRNTSMRKTNEEETTMKGIQNGPHSLQSVPHQGVIFEKWQTTN